MKTTFSIAALLAVSVFACAAPTEEPQEPEIATVDTTSTSTPQMINRGGCTPSQLALGGWEEGGVCFSGGGGGGGGGGGSGACYSRCGTSSARCEASCEARGGANACFQNCFRLESICYENCH